MQQFRRAKARRRTGGHTAHGRGVAAPSPLPLDSRRGTDMLVRSVIAGFAAATLAFQPAGRPMRVGTVVRRASLEGDVPRTAQDTASLSREFNELCETQFKLLGAVLNATTCALYLRKEARSGALEFSPVAVWPGRPRRIWVAHSDGDSVHGADVEVRGARLELSGGFEAPSLLPEYPFVSLVGRDDKSGEEMARSLSIAGGGLSVPLVHGSVVLGLLGVWRRPDGGDPCEPDSMSDECAEEAKWSVEERRQIEHVASSLALTLVLDQRRHAAMTAARAVQAEQVRVALASSLHQAKNPLLALRTFAMLLLRRLPGDDAEEQSVGGANVDSFAREIARDICVQADRLGELLGPMDSLVGALAHISEGSAAEPSLLPEALAQALLHDSTAEAFSAYSMGALPQGELPPLLPPKADSTGTAVELHGSREAAALPVFADEVMLPVVNAARAIAERDGITLRVVMPPVGELPGAEGDERALREALTNVVDNALKYVRTGGTGGAGNPEVTLTLSCVEPDGGDGMVVIEVRDNGPGVPTHERPHIFERGFRGSNGSGPGGVDGSGLGLHIAQALIADCGGQLSLGEEEEGAVVRIALRRFS